MSDDYVNPDEAAARARAIIEADVDARVDAVRRVADAVTEYDAAETRLREATAAHDRSWSTALAAGWSEKDLRAAGLRAPGQPPRPRRRRTTATSGATPSEG